MKIRKEYGERVFRALYYFDDFSRALDNISYGVTRNPISTLIGDENLPFMVLSDMHWAVQKVRGDETVSYNDNLQCFFNEFVEGGYQEPLYYVRDKFTDTQLYNVRELYTDDSYPRWFTENQCNEFDGPGYLLKHTKQEWLDINPAYEKMLVEVEE